MTKKFLSTALSGALILLSPGLGCYQAMADMIEKVNLTEMGVEKAATAGSYAPAETERFLDANSLQTSAVERPADLGVEACDIRQEQAAETDLSETSEAASAAFDESAGNQISNRFALLKQNVAASHGKVVALLGNFKESLAAKVGDAVDQYRQGLNIMFNGSSLQPARVYSDDGYHRMSSNRDEPRIAPMLAKADGTPGAGDSKEVPAPVNMTESAKKVLAIAQLEAKRLRHYRVGTEHILLAIFEQPEGAAQQALRGSGIRQWRLRALIEKLVGVGDNQKLSKEFTLTPGAKKALKLAEDEARQMGVLYLGPEHLLLGLMREKEGVAARALNYFDLKLDATRKEVIALLGLPPGFAARQHGMAAAPAKAPAVFDMNLGVIDRTAEGLSGKNFLLQPGQSLSFFLNGRHVYDLGAPTINGRLAEQSEFKFAVAGYDGVFDMPNRTMWQKYKYTITASPETPAGLYTVEFPKSQESGADAGQHSFSFVIEVLNPSQSGVARQ